MKRQGWAVVVASTLALIVGQGAISVFAAGVFLKPMSVDLGFGRGQISTAIGISNLMIAVATPFFGRLLDVYGVRVPLLASIVLYALAIALIGTTSGSVFSLYALFALAGFVGVGQNPGSYSKVIAEWFDRQRGLALGIALTGVGIGTAAIPRVSEALINNFGWRLGYVGLGGVILLLAAVPTALFLREPDKGDAAARSAAQSLLVGMSLSEAARDLRFWKVLIAFFFATVAINGTLVHLVPMLTDRGVPLPQAVAVISSAGLALIIGRLLAGWLIDRIYAPYVAVFFLVCPLIGLLVLAAQPAGVPPIVGAILLGAGIGAEVDLLSYIVSRYFGVRYFGAVYGLMFTSVVVGNAVGAMALGWTFQLHGNYVPTLYAYCALLAVASALLLMLGAYKYPPLAK